MFNIDIKSREPIYAQLEKAIVKYIRFGVYSKDSMLPSVRALAFDLGINPNTVQKAYRELEQKGIIYTVPGKGAFVSGGDSLGAVHTEMLSAVKKVLTDAKNSGVMFEEAEQLMKDVWET
ncbi:MAG: GntR family transcriptional regulator [Clostridiales bacterium]|nr:GntR family transcriptional regulator [Clostridiales bacterium]